MQQGSQVAVEHAGRCGRQLIEQGGGGVLHPRKGLGAPARIAEIGGHQLHLDFQVVRPGGAALHIGVVADAKAAADDARAQGLVDVLGAELAQAALGKSGARRPGWGRPVGGQILEAMADARLDQDLIGAEPGRLDGQADAVLEAHENRVQVGDVLLFGDLADGAEVEIGPGEIGLGRGRRHRRDLVGGQGVRDELVAAVDGDGRRDQQQGSRTGEGPGQGRVDLGGRKALHRGLEQGQVLGRAGLHLGRGQGGDHVIGDRGGGARGCAVGHSLQIGALGVDFGGQFLSRDAVLRQSTLLGDLGVQSRLPLAGPGVGAHSGHPGRVELLPAIGGRPDKGRAVRADQAVQPAVQHRQAQAFDGLAPATRGAVGGQVGQGDPAQLDARRSAGLDDQLSLRAALQGASAVGLPTGGALTGPSAELGLDPGLHGVGIKIAHGDDHRPLRAIIAMVIVGQQIVGGALDRVDLADGEAIGGQLALQHLGEALFQHVIAGGVAQPLLGQHDALFLVHHGLVQGQLAGDFAQQHQAGAHRIVVGLGQVQLVDRLFPRGGGVGVGAEGQAVALEDLDHLPRRHMGRAVEGHVFQKMGQALLRARLLQRAGVDPQAQGGLAARSGVLHHHIAQTVGQGSKAHGRVGRQIRIGLRPGVRRRRLGGHGFRGQGGGRRDLAAAVEQAVARLAGVLGGLLNRWGRGGGAGSGRGAVPVKRAAGGQGQGAARQQAGARRSEHGWA